MCLPGLGVTVGFHRLLTHRAFKTTRPVRAALAILGSAAIEGPVISWVADHRKHHAFADREGDPHSPHVDHGHGWRGALRGLVHAHVGWLFIHTHRGRRTRYAPDLLARPGRELGRPDVPGVGAWRARRRVRARLAVRRHAARRPHRPFVGRRGADACAPPRDLQHQLAVPLLRAPALRHRRSSRATSRGWRRCRSARRGTTTTTRSRPPPSTVCAAGSSTPPRCVIRALERLGLAWDVVRVSPERQAARLAALQAR